MAINDVSLTSGMRANLLSLQETVSLLDRTQSRLSTGKKVNSAIDNPISFFASQALTSRASTIDSLKDAMGQAVQTITAADKGIKALTVMIEQAKGIAQSALSAEASTTADPFAGTAANAITYANITIDLAATVTDAGTIQIGGQTFTALSTDTTAGNGSFADAAALAAEINANTTLSTAGWIASEASGVITLRNSTMDVTTASVTDGTAATIAANVTHAEVMSITIGGTAYTGASAATTALAADALEAVLTAVTAFATSTVADSGAVAVTYDAVPSAEQASLTAQYNTVREQMTALAEDSGYKGKNLLSSDNMVVKFEGANLTVSGFDASATGLGVTEAAWTNETQMNASIAQLDAALETMISESSKLSGNLSIITVRQDFSTNMINTLTAGSDKLTLADTNEEGANMLMLQTRQSLSTTALSLSAQAAQSVLKLFA
jgi:flagellin